MLDYYVLLFKPTVIFPSFANIPRVNNNLLVSLFNIHNIIMYTDVYKWSDGTGCAFFVPNSNQCFRFIMSNISSIYIAEVYEI